MWFQVPKSWGHHLRWAAMRSFFNPQTPWPRLHFRDLGHMRMEFTTQLLHMFLQQGDAQYASLAAGHGRDAMSSLCHLDEFTDKTDNAS